MSTDNIPRRTKYKAIILAAMGLIGGGVAMYYAISGEITGKTFALETRDKGALFVPVSREESPEEFRRADHFLRVMSILGFGIGIGGVWFYRGLKDSE